MGSNKNSKKARKPIETTLGKAPSNPKEKDNDMSHLRKPIETSIYGIKQLLSVLESATNEVKTFVMYECDIMYECRICRSIYRSLANFILHKRNFCRDKINPLDYINTNETYQEQVHMSGETSQFSKNDNKSINNVIKKLQELDHIKEVAKLALTEDLSSEKVKGMDEKEEKLANFNQVVLEKIDSNNSGVFQTLVGKSNSDCNMVNTNKGKSTKLEVMEIHKILENDVPVLDPEGKICGFTSNKVHQPSIFPKSEFNCTECSHRFSSQKSLNNHIKYVHNPSRIVYICPNCKDTFANPWCVYRHLLKVHRMSNKQVRRLREQIHNSCIRRGEESSIQKKKPPDLNQGEVNRESQWINDIEGDKDFQMCAGCGKHFERKAALHSHSQMCAKRLEVCNNIKKKAEDEAAEKAKLERSADEKSLLKGACKRKGQSICSYQRKPRDVSEINKEMLNTIDINSSSLHNLDVVDSFNAISNILTPKPSPCKDENSASLNLLIEKIKQQKHQDFKMKNLIELGEGESNVKKEKQDIRVEAPRTSVSLNTDINDSKSEIITDAEKIFSSINPKSGKITLGESYRPSSSLSVNSIKSLSPNKSKTSQETDLRPRSDSFIERNNKKFCASFKTISLNGNEPVESSESKVKFDEEGLIPAIKSEALSEDDTRLNTYSPNITIESSLSSDIEGQDDCILIQDNDDLLSNHITFEMFCKKVDKVKKSKGECSKSLETKKISPRVLRKKRKLTDFIEKSDKPNNTNASKNDDDDDVIFVGETVIDTNQSHNTSLALENGFAGFSNEETTQGYSVDISALSYNNPLKCKQNDDFTENTKQSLKKPLKRKNRGQSVDSKTTISKRDKNEFNFILRAAPYMNQAKLLCIPCGTTFKSFNLLLWHMSAHFSWFRFQCSKCSFITFNKYDCMLHARKQHKFKENNVANFILPLPNWKTVLMSHEFRLLRDCDVLKGKHTDEKIGIDEGQDQNSDNGSEILETETMLFGESSRNSEEGTDIVIEKENVKKRSKSGKTVIDIQESINDFQKLPEPLELAMPADVSEVIRTLSFDEDNLSADEAVTILENFGEESNDDWGLPKESECEIPVKTNIILISRDCDNKETVKDGSIASNIRPSRIRTKAKQNDDFVYYDNDINNALKTTDFLKSNSQKHRNDSGLTVKAKVSGKTVPMPQKKKT